MNPKLQFLIDFFPGKSLLTKAAIAGSTAAVSGYLVHAGYYIPGEDTYAVAGFGVFARLFYMKLGRPISDYLGNEVWAERQELEAKFEGCRRAAREDITLLESFRDNFDVNQALFDMKMENIRLEAQVAEMRERVQFMSGIKGKLQELVAQERQRQAAEKKEFDEAVKRELLIMLSKPDVQQRIMEQSLKNLESLPINTV